MSKSELLLELETLSRRELDEVAEKVDELRGAPLTPDERALIRDRVTHYRNNPNDIIALNDAISDILTQSK
jgi:hypothetical protein